VVRTLLPGAKRGGGMVVNEERVDDLMPIIACSTGAITRWPDATDAERLERWCPVIHAGSFEAMFYDTWYGQSGAIADRLRSLGVQWSAVHAEKNIGPSLIAEARSTLESSLAGLAENCKFARQVGAGLVVLHLWGLPDGDAKLGRQLEVLPRLVEIAEADGVLLGIEAIPCAVNTPLENLERVVAADPRARIVLDTEFLAMHGELDLALDASWLWTENRVARIHIKDFNGVLVDQQGRRRYLHPGEGTIPFDRWFHGLVMRGYAGPIVLEATAVDSAGAVDVSRLNRSLERLRILVRTAWAEV
jgi:sugar phosphate isomerase/epimerase